jgi:hypothetical protein
MPIMSAAILAHQFGLALGLGGAFCAEMVALGALKGPLRAETLHILRRLSHVVLLGFVILCLSGGTFLAVYAEIAPDKLLNPKLWAKIAVVLTLGVNGIVIHRFVLPRLAQQVGRPILAGFGRLERAVVLLVASVSAISWPMAAVLGSVRELNRTVAFEVLLAAWLILVAVSFLGAVAGFGLGQKPTGPDRDPRIVPVMR